MQPPSAGVQIFGIDLTPVHIPMHARSIIVYNLRAKLIRMDRKAATNYVTLQDGIAGTSKRRRF